MATAMSRTWTESHVRRRALSRSTVRLVLLALVIRVGLVPFTLHVDLRFIGDLVAINQYAHLVALDPGNPLRVAPLYPLLAYYTTAASQILLSPFCPAIPVEIFSAQAGLSWLSAPSVFRALFCFKAWYLLFDLGSAYLLWRMYRDDGHKANMALAFWLFNPIIIYNAYFHGQFDVVPLFLTVASLYLARRQRPLWAAFFIGIAACYKNYAFFFLLPAILILAGSWRKRIALLAAGAVPYVLLLLPRLTEYSHSVSSYGDWFFKVGYDVGFGVRVYMFFVLYAALAWYLYHTKAHTFEDFWRSCFVILLVYYQFSYLDLHYWAWIMPFAAIYLVERPREAAPFYVVILACLLILQMPAPLGRFLAPISPRFFLRLPSLLEALTPYLPMYFLLNVVRSLLAGTCFYLAWRLLRDLPASRRDAVPAASGQAVTA